MTTRSYARLLARSRVASRWDQMKHRLGIVQFSSESQTRLEIGLGHDATAIANAISRMQYLAGTTDMDGGLQLGLDELRANGRASVPKVIVLMSDGQPNQGDPQPVADAAKAEGVRVLTIGVGDRIDVGLMRSLASPPASQTFFYAEEFDALMELVDRLVVSTCPTPGTPTPEPTPTRDARLTHTKYFPSR